MKPTAAAVVSKIASTVATVSGKVWLGEAGDGETLPYATYTAEPAGPDVASFDGTYVERMMFTIRIYAEDASVASGYLDSLATAFAAKATKLTLSSGAHLGTYTLGRTLPIATRTAAGVACYRAELRLRIESTRA